MLLEELAPLVEWAGVFAAIAAGHEVLQRLLRGENEFEKMDVAAGGEPGLQTLENGGSGGGVYVVQKAVHQNEVKAGCDGLVVAADVRNNELAIVLFPGMGDIAGIDINADVVGVGEEVGVGAGAAADVQDATGAVEGIVGEQGRQFGRDKRRLPQAIDEGLFEQIVEDAHSEGARSLWRGTGRGFLWIAGGLLPT